MQRYRFALKLALIFGIIILLLLPQALLMGLISERAGWRNEAYGSIAQSWPGPQTLAGPLVMIPYTLTYNVTETLKDANGNERQVTKEVKERQALPIIPKQLKAQSQLDSSLRYRGIYQVPVYSNQLQIAGQFETQALLDLLANTKDKAITLEPPFLSVLVRDQRGIASIPVLTWGGQALAFKPSSNIANASAGMNAKLPEFKTDTNQSFDFSFKLELRGMADMNYALLAENSEVTMSSNWQHPKFSGELLPEQRTINEKGFTATWRTSSFSYNVQTALDAAKQGDYSQLMSRAIGFELLQPVDVYQQSERSIKYAFLFIVLTFTVLIVFELVKKLRIHPVQYVLVGLALTVFYLLLISLSEHINFLLAYLLATAASTGLLTLYFSAILHNRQLGLALGGGLLGLYALLYMILQAEDNALLMGSLLIFTALASLMLLTRHFDWYALTAMEELAKPHKTPHTQEIENQKSTLAHQE
ncbi:cell envelope integrity protein CreD [Thiolinea disciformis]|uniref:cell envelope integrity protein CreD n=1 Tax=Thiolinea disciformis TaxID=125614 RepID=UPI00037DE3BB|nr:cell envelope integrity protein CreD [Thiolinea disciformis]